MQWNTNLVLLIVVLVVMIGHRVWRTHVVPRLWPAVRSWDGAVTAVIVRYTKHARWKGTEEPLWVRVLITPDAAAARRGAAPHPGAAARFGASAKSGASTKSGGSGARGNERVGGWQLPETLPRELRRAVFGNGYVHDALNPRLNLPTAQQRREAMRQATEGGYRFEVSEPLPVHVDETAKGSLRWHPHR